MIENKPSEATPALLPANLLGDPDRLTVARSRGELLTQQIAFDPEILPTSIAGYSDCERAHEELMAERARAEDGFLRANGHLDVPTKGGDALTSWFIRTQVLSGDEAASRTTAIATEVVTGLKYGDPGSNISNIAVNTHVVYRLSEGRAPSKTEYFTNDFLGAVLFRGDAEEVSFLQEDLTPRSFSALEAEIRQRLALQARREAVAPLVGELLAIRNSVTQTELPGQVYTLDKQTDRPLINLLNLDFTSEEVALDALESVFDPKNRDSFTKILEISLDNLMTELALYNATERFNWLTRVLAPTQRHVQQTTEMAISSGFSREFTGLLEAEAVKVARLNALTGVLRGLKRINEHAPVKIRPQELTSLK